MASSIVGSKIKALCLFFVNIFRRALCCFRRRRRPSNDFVQLTHVVSNQDDKQADIQTWNDWTNKTETFDDYDARAIQDQIEEYRRQKVQAKQRREEEMKAEEENFFDDMTPRITRQKKVFLEKESDDVECLNRLALDANGVIAQGDELGEWQENSGWEAETRLDWATKEALTEKKRLRREQRIREQQQKRLEKNNRPGGLGARLS